MYFVVISEKAKELNYLPFNIIHTLLLIIIIIIILTLATIFSLDTSYCHVL